MKKAYQLKQADSDSNQVFEHEEKTSLRINKYLTASGFCSRRQADRLISEDKVTIDGEVATLGAQVSPNQTVVVGGKHISLEDKHVYIALNKPVGITCTVDQEIEGNITDFMDYPKRIFPIGRLDKDSSGLILLTSDGDIVNKILRSENNHEKEYIVKVNRKIESDFIRQMSEGVEITNTKKNTRVITKKCKVKKIDSRTFKIILTQGYNRQIRRMCTELGYRVVALQRVRIMNIHLEALKIGQWRYLTKEELLELNKSV